MHGDVSLRRDGHGHDVRRRHGDHLPRVEQPGEKEGVGVAGPAEALAHGLQDGPGQVAGVEAGQGNQQQVERVTHLAGAQDQAGVRRKGAGGEGEGERVVRILKALLFRLN